MRPSAVPQCTVSPLAQSHAVLSKNSFEKLSSCNRLGLVGSLVGVLCLSQPGFPISDFLCVVVVVIVSVSFPAECPPHVGSVNLDPSLPIQLGILTSHGGLSCPSWLRVGIQLLLHFLRSVGRASRPFSWLEWMVLSSQVPASWPTLGPVPLITIPDLL